MLCLCTTLCAYDAGLQLRGGVLSPMTLSSLPDQGGQDIVIIRPEAYEHALRNPMKGFTNRGFDEHNEWATLVHSYIRWNQIENHESDGIDKIRQWCDAQWQGVARRNQKVIPRVYLHWSGDRKYWPADMTPDDYSSEQFVQRVTRLIKRLGICWDTDPRVAHIEMGLIGKWGEHHSPAPTPEIERLLGKAFEWRPLMRLGDRLYRLIGNNRAGVLGQLSARFLPYRPLWLRLSRPEALVVVVLTAVIFAHNITTLPKIVEPRPIIEFCT